MDTGRRVTLDNAGLGYRTRNYADSYVPRPVVPQLVNDMVVVQQPKQETALNEVIAEKAKEIVEHSIVPQASVQVVQPVANVAQVFAAPEQAQPIVQRPARSQEGPAPIALEELVSSIQQTSKTIAFDTQLVQSVAEEPRKKLGLNRLFASRRSIVTSAMALLLFVGGTMSLVASISSNDAVVQQAQALSEASSEENSTGESTGFGDLSEEEIPESTVRGYSVAANYPKYIRINKLSDRSSRILRMGIDESNTINTPRSIWDAGWYDGSSLPGDKVGASLILGHVSGPNEPGIFYNLYRVQNGDTIEVEMGDGTIYEYTVVGKEEVSTGSINMNNYLVSKDIDKPGLTLMTCAGEFNPGTQQYENRLAVFAVRSL